MALIDRIINLFIPALILVHLVVAPYTKVEESFSLQATHDVLAYGIPIKDIQKNLVARYDHFDFPGAVPRTFLGPVMLAGLSQPIVALFGFQHAQLIVRAVLGLLNAGALLVFKSNIEKVLGSSTARWFALLQATQFHIMFYASRTLPNMFAFFLTTWAFSMTAVTVPDQKKQIKRFKLAIYLLTFAAAVFRSELAVLLAVTVFQAVVLHKVPVTKLVLPFIASFVLSLAISIPLDSYFWQKPLWPELWGFYFNVVQGSSSEWGTSPWYTYFQWVYTKLLPNPIIAPIMSVALMPTSLFPNLGTKKTVDLGVPSLLYMAILGFLPHKEFRFIFYIAPPVMALAAAGMNEVWVKRPKGLFDIGLNCLLVLSVLLGLAHSSGMLIISALNYPGGDALTELKKLVSVTLSADLQAVTVHTDVLSCMTGVTLFGQHDLSPSAPKPNDETVKIVFDKTEDESVASPVFWDKFDYVLVEDRSKVFGGPWETVGVVEGFTGVELLKPGQEPQEVDVDASPGTKVVGRGALLKQARDLVRKLTGGWWVGPKMAPQINILRRIRGTEKRRAVTE